MASLKGLVLVLAVRVTLIASLKTKDLSKNAWSFQDIFHPWHGKAVKDETVALVSAGAGKGAGKDAPAKGKMKKKLAAKLAPSWCDATVTSNLGGLGPDTSAPPELRYAHIPGIRTLEGAEKVDMVVTALNEYKAKKPSANGFNNGGHNSNNGCFGIINLDDAHGSTSVDLEFSFVDSATGAPVTAELFTFMLFDIDMGEDNTAIESLTVYNDLDRYLSPQHPMFSQSGDLENGEPVTFTATTYGDGSDNPRNPDKLTSDQLDKTFIGIYEKVQKFKLTFSVTGGSGGRNFMFAGKSPPAAPPMGCQSEDCVVWGDPHVLTFDAHREFMLLHPNQGAFFQRRNRKHEMVNVLEEGRFWLVKSNDVHIQGRYNKVPHQNTTVLGGLAVGGPFLKGNTLILRPLVGKITWNGEHVLSKLGSEFSNDLINARYQSGVEDILHGSPGNGVEVTLPGDVKLIVNRRARGLAVKISMCAREWQDGQCGNFNGDSTDDTQEELMKRVQPVHHSESLPWRQHLHPGRISKRQEMVHLR